MISLSDIEAAAERLSGAIERTPFRKSVTLSEITGCEVWIKFENLQYTASFKERGALNKLSLLQPDERRAGVIAMSAGNHAQGVAHHANRLGVPATIVMPVGTPTIKVEHTRKFGAEVILHGETLADAEAYAYDLCDRRGLVFVHPYNDEAVMAGQGTVALEMLDDGPPLNAVVAPVGGGGLMSGVATAFKARRREAEVIAVEPALYPSLTLALNNLTGPCGGATIAEGIAVKTVGANCLEVIRSKVERTLLVDEASIEQAIALFATVEKTVAEGAGAAGLAAVLQYPDVFQGKTVGLILCGGNIDTRILASVLNRSLVRERRLFSIRIKGSDQPGFLGKVGKLIGDAGGNIIEVAHNRLSLDLPAKLAEFDILVETRDAAHSDEILAVLQASGLMSNADVTNRE